MPTKITHIASTQAHPIRLQEYGIGIFPTLATKSALKKALKKKLITVNGDLATTATFIRGDEVIIFHPEDKKQQQKLLILALEIIYEDDHLAIINKPPGILVSGNSFKTVANALAQNLKPSTQFNAITPQPAHRLDYATTGLLLIGKTSSTLLALNQLFEHKKILKTYLAVTIGAMPKKGILSSPVDDKKAISKFQVLKTEISQRFQSLNLVKLSPETGRRHQLRKQLLALGNPILGDATYYQENLILKGKGLYLHAYSLEFKHPITAEKMHLKKEVPLKFYKLFPEI